MKPHRIPAWLPVSLAVILAASFLTRAGSLIPPPGPVGGTMKTLVEIEPRTAINATNTPPDADSLFKITLPGSYYLTGNITGAGARHGIEIAASGVSIDLMGFEMAGIPGSFVGIITPLAATTDITVHNGTIRDWPLGGLDLSTSTGISLSDLSIRANGGPGIGGGAQCTLTRCRAVGNMSAGLSTGDGGIISHCSASATTGTGIIAGNGSVVTSCTASGNTDNGFLLGNGCSLVDSAARGNTDNGIIATAGCTIQRCTVAENTLDGIEVASGCLVTNNNCRENGVGAGSGAGIHVTGSDNRIEANNVGANDRGIEFGFMGNNTVGRFNIVVKNTATGTANNYLFHPLGIQNVYGQIVSLPAGGEINAANSNAWANFEY